MRSFHFCFIVRQRKLDAIEILQQYSCSFQDFRRRWENTHNGVHRWIGGTMARSLAAADPVFYMHHAFIDYQWEKFREQQILICNIDPEADYPPTDNDDHFPDTRMDGMRYLDNIDGIAPYWTENWYNYAESPSCENNCYYSPDMFCDEELGRCVSEMATDASTGSRRKRQTTREDDRYRLKPVEDNCKTRPYDDGCTILRKPKTEKQLIDAVIQHEIRVPQTIKEANTLMQARIRTAESSPPESEELFFRSSSDEENDPRVRESSLFDLSKAVVEGRKLSQAMPSRETAMLNDMI